MPVCDRHVLTTRIGTGARRAPGGQAACPALPRADDGTRGRDRPRPTEPRRVGVSAAERRDEQSTKQPQATRRDARLRPERSRRGMCECARPRVAQQLRRQTDGRAREDPGQASASASASDQVDRPAMDDGGCGVLVRGHAAWPVVGIDCAAFGGPHILFCFLAHRVKKQTAGLPLLAHMRPCLD